MKGKDTRKDNKRTTKISKGKSNTKVSKSKSKAARAKIERLNADLDKDGDITDIMTQETSEKKKNILDAKSLKEDLEKEKKRNENNKAVESDIQKQLDIISEMGL